MEVIKTYEQGELIFKQGDASDSMLMIKDGSVEVFKETPQGEVLLTVQGAGEVIGMLTFFNSGNRLASARARTVVEGQLIMRVAGQDPLAKLPKWVQIVLKEFTTRLEQINDQFARSEHAKNDLMIRVVDPLFVSVQLASSLMALGASKSRKSHDGREMIALPDCLELIRTCLNVEKKEIERVIDVFKTTGLINIERDPDTGKDALPLQGIQRLKWYVDFAQSSRMGKNRRLVQMQIAAKHRKQLFALREYVQKTGADPSKPYSTDLTLLAEQFPRLMEMPLDGAALEAGEKLEVLEIKRSAEKGTVSFHPGELIRTLIAINTVRRLRVEPGTDDLTES